MKISLLPLPSFTLSVAVPRLCSAVLQGTAAAEAKDLLTDQQLLMSMGSMDLGPSATKRAGGDGKGRRKIVG